MYNNSSRFKYHKIKNPSNFNKSNRNIQRSGSSRSTPLLARQRAAYKGLWSEWWFDHFHHATLKTSLYVCSIIMLGTAELVFRKVIATNLFNYRWFLAQLLAILTFVVTLIPMCIRKTFRRKRVIKLRSFAWMGFLDMWHCNLLIVSLGILPGTLTAMIPQLIPPFTLGFNLLIGNVQETSRRFQISTLAGTIITIIGIITGLTTYLLNTPKHVLEEEEAVTRSEVLINGILMIVSCIPAAMNNVFKQSFLSKDREDILLFNCFVSFYQVIFGFIFAPLFIHLQYVSTGLKPDVPLDVGHLFINFSDGLKCLVGTNSHNYDSCNTNHSQFITFVIVYIILLSLYDWVMLGLIGRSERQSIYHLPIIVSMLLAFVIFSFHASANELIVVELLRPSYDINIGPIIGVLCTAIGMFVFSFHDPPPNNEVNLWECMEDGKTPRLKELVPQSATRFGTFQKR